MSRIVSVALLAAFTSIASAQSFAKPPQAPAVSRPDMVHTENEVRRALPTRAEVRLALAEARAKNIASFHAYMRSGRYPNNVYARGAANVWRDQQGNFCAAATIMVMSGSEDLATQIAEDNNFLRLADIKQGAIMDWMLLTGLTQEELVMIQKPFNPVSLRPQPRPDQIVSIDPGLRAAETARLRAKYKAVDSQLARGKDKALDLATDRLMKHPELAWRLVNAG